MEKGLWDDGSNFKIASRVLSGLRAHQIPFPLFLRPTNTSCDHRVNWLLELTGQVRSDDFRKLTNTQAVHCRKARTDPVP